MPKIPSPPETDSIRMNEFLSWIWRKINPLTGTTNEFEPGAVIVGDSDGFFGTDSLGPVTQSINGNRLEIPGILSRSSALGVLNTTTETTIFTTTIPAGIMGNNRAIHTLLLGGYVNNSGSNRTFTLRIKLNGTTYFEDTSSSLPSDAAGRAFWCHLVFKNQGAANNNRLKGLFILSSPGGVTTGAGGNLAANASLFNIPDAGNNPNVDTASPVTFAVTVQHSNADTSWFQDPVDVELK